MNPFVHSFGKGPGTALGQFNLPFGLCGVPSREASSGWTVAVVDKKNHRVVLCAMDPKATRSIGNGRGTGMDQFNGPRDVAYHAGLGALLVTDCQNHCVKIVTLSGAFIGAVGRGPGAGDDELDSPHGIDVLPSGLVVVVDCHNDRLVIADVAGRRFVRTIGNGRGSAPTQFHGPHCVAVTGDGLMAVTDYRNHRVVIVSQEGAFLRTVEGGLRFPVGVCAVPKGIAVIDSNHHRVVVFSDDGSQMSLGSGPGSGHGELNFPGGVAFLPQYGLLVISDHNNHRLEFVKFGDCHEEGPRQ